VQPGITALGLKEGVPWTYAMDEHNAQAGAARHEAVRWTRPRAAIVAGQAEGDRLHGSQRLPVNVVTPAYARQVGAGQPLWPTAGPALRLR
jgi:hypothetical protein